MSEKKKSFFEKLKSEFLTDDGTEIDAEKPLAPQIDNAVGVKPLANNPIFANTMSSQTPFPNSGMGYQALSLTPEENAKWEKYFNDLFNSLNDPQPSYHEFIATANAFAGLPDAQRFGATMMGFKIQGLTKEVLLQTAEDSLVAIQKDGETFQKEIQSKIEEKVTKQRQECQQIQEQILKLQEEIQQRMAEAQMNEEKYQRNINAYNAISQQYQSKIASDINNIKNFVQ